MRKFVERPDKSVLCVGHISEERHKYMISFKTPLETYQDKLRLLYRSLSAEGYNTYIHTAWGIFEVISAGMLQIAKPGIIQDLGSDMVYSLAVFETGRTFLNTPPYANYFDGILTPQQDEACITTDDIFNDVLSNVSVVLYDNDECDPFIQAVLEKALYLGKRLVNINAAALP